MKLICALIACSLLLAGCQSKNEFNRDQPVLDNADDCENADGSPC